MALQVPRIQTWAAHKAVKKVESLIDGKASIDRITIVFYNRVILENVSIVGTPGDTLAHIGKLSVNVSTQNLLRKKIKVNRVIIDSGVFNFIEEGTNKESNLTRIFKIGPKKDKKKGNIPDMAISEVRLRNFRFHYYSTKKPKTPVDPDCMDYTDIWVSNINARINRAEFKKGRLTCRIQNISAFERCGLDLKELRGDFSLDSHTTKIENLILRDAYSNVNAKYLSFSYESGRDLKDFINKISLGAQFNKTLLDFRTISNFTPALKKSTLALKISGTVSGPVSKMKASKMNVTSSDGETYVSLTTSITGLPDINSTIFDATIFDLYTTTDNIADIIASFSGSPKNTKISSMSPDVRYYFAGGAYGTIHKLSANGELSSNNGDAAFKIKMDNRGKKEGLRLGGYIYTKDFDIGAIIGNNKLGKASISTSLEANIKSKEYGGIELGIDSLRINRFGFNGYDYSNLFAVGNYSQKKFDGRILCHDPNLHFMLQGVFSLSELTNESKYNLYADISFADLAALNFDKRDEVSQVSLRTMANLTVGENKNISGQVDIKNFTYWNSTGEFEIGSISLTSTIVDDDYSVKLQAPFLQADLVTTESPIVFINRLTDNVFYDHFSDVFAKKESKDTMPAIKGRSSFHARTYNMKPICSMLSPGLYIADSTTIDLSLNEEDSLRLALQSHRIGFKSNSIKDISLELTNPDSLLSGIIKCENIKAGSINIDNDSIAVLVNGGIIDIKYIFQNDGDVKNEMEFSTDVFFSRDSASNLLTNIYIHDSELYLQNYKWHFLPSSIIIGKGYYALNDFCLFNDNQKITANGTISHNPNHSLSLDMDHFDLNMINAFLKNDMQIKGSFTGKATVSDLFGTPNILMDLKGKNVSLFDNQVGDLNILSKWDRTNKRIALLIDNRFQDNSPLNISGYYKPNGKYLNLNVSLRNFALTYIEPFLDGIISNTSGTLSGDLELFGTLDKLNLTSYNTRFDNFSFTPVFTQVPYTLNGPVEMTETGINLLGVELKDKFGKTASITGGLSHRFFKDMYLDAKLAFKDLQCLNTEEKDNSTFYGSAFGSGAVTITGPFNDLFMDVTFATGSNTSIHVPLSGSASATNKDLLSFVQNTVIIEDPYEEGYIEPNKQVKPKSKFELRAKASVNSETELFIEINKQLGDILRCKGNGTIDVAVNPSKDILDLHGDYTIDEGSYRLALMGITAKDFIINNGGSIGFNGGIMNTNLNVGATYRTKASISTLISDTSAVGNRRNVDCGIHMTGSLLNPNISFSIDVPDLDPITKGRVESALSTDSKVQKQFMALLISGSFVPDEQSGIVNNTTILYSNAGEILSNQFNNVFRQLGIPLDLGLNYQPGDGKGKGTNMFDVALSYQAFNNRVVINGNVGNSQNSSRGWMGNFEAEVKLDKKGKMRLNAFTRSADDYSNYLDNTQRNGLGFTYQDEFDSFGDLFRSIFYSKKKKEEYETRQIIEAEKALKKEAEDAKAKKVEILKPKESEYKYY